MAQRCPSCGGEVFLGETRCPACKASIPGAADAARRAGIESGADPSGPPPPEGLSLIVRKGVADQEARHQEDARVRWDDDGIGYEPGIDATVDELARLTRPTRDARGNVVWDWRYALIGGIVVAVVVGLLAFVAYGWATSATSGTNRYRTSTTSALPR
ncbi:MAG: hypothetical protein R2726_22620 [Acidimicrobiales bacterium]